MESISASLLYASKLLIDFKTTTLNTTKDFIVKKLFPNLSSIRDRISVKFDTTRETEETDAAVMYTERKNDKRIYKIRINREITLNNPILNKRKKVFYNGNVVKSKRKLIVFVICHELCHIIVNRYYKLYGHGQTFCCILKEYTGFISPYHTLNVDLLMLKERANAMKSYKKGDKVFVFSEEDSKDINGTIIEISHTFCTVKTKHFIIKTIREFLRPYK